MAEAKSQSKREASRRSARTPKRGRGGRSKRWIIWSIAAVALLACMGIALPYTLSGAPTTVAVRIPANATAAMAADSVRAALPGVFGRRVLTMAKLMGVDWSKRHGMYTVQAGMSPARAARLLTAGAETPVKLTINGFRKPEELARRIAAKMDFTAADLMEAMTDSAFLADYNLSPRQGMALFVDDTYEVYWSATPKQVLQKIGNNYRKLWDKRRTDKAAALGLTPAQAMIVCSIVDEETNAAEEKGTVGRLYANRLRIGMPLQADPTVRYASGDFTLRRIGAAQLAIESPYNTYKHKGLPPGPIRTTSRATVDALLDSPPSDFIYMCAKEDFSGRHNFASTYADHQRNAARYRAELDRRGIK